jgi:hypothetical protein
MAYEYYSTEVKFQKSTVCLESTFYADFMSLGPTIIDLFNLLIGNNEKEEGVDACDSGASFDKIKYASQNT